jgi:TrmH family RNA methyltransferase
MLSAAARARLAVVMVGARNPQNIGAAARAMQDFGFSDLRFVNPYTAPFEAAKLESVKSAVGAASVMASARAYEEIGSALADVTLAVGTTAIGGRELQHEVRTLQASAPEILNTLHAAASGEDDGRVALVFGSEKTGLTNEQLSHCQRLLTIPLFAPAASRHLSMNLGQSVAVCLYELTREGMENARELPVVHPKAPNGEDRERLTRLLLNLMHATGYARRFPANARETVVRHLAQQLGASREEAATWLGILRQALPKAPGESGAQ